METDRYHPDAAVRTQVRKQWGVSDNEVVVGTIARLFKNKGYEEILAAMPGIVSQCPHVRFVWVGDGANRAEYERRLASLGLQDRVHLTGLVSPSKVAKQLAGFDILLHASKWEGLPRAVVQGLLTEVPAISFDNDGAPEVVTTDETGMLVPHGDIDVLTTAVATLANDSDARQRMGSEGRNRCLAMFGWQVMAEQLEALYTLHARMD